jgi:hypothetical protein
VSLPTSLTTVDSNPFPGCVNLTTITVAPANTTFSTRDGMLLDKAETTLIGYPSASGTVTLPFTTIGGMAFEGCDNLAFVSLPAATSIGGFAFWHCDNLTTVSLPAATSIGRRSFELCRALTTVSLPTTPPSLDGGIFSYIDSTGTITVSVPTGAVPAYTSAWGVDANTPAGGNHSVYGENHKAVLITDN